ncbi:hypothetical protein [Nocardia transvalensis]|uniref:hypothetical protein n=1 Tax=Nocardia transvalensis TaxID=37333 RepID=UPI0018937348|nr:hypothetical protein [Nocardia transvalensis]MBF6327885.1 hypothetical protein [Nocardia transvalensis]
MSDGRAFDREVVREWLAGTTEPVQAGEDEPRELVRAVLSRLAEDDQAAPTSGLLTACSLLLVAARTELDRMELELMSTASERGLGWSAIAESFGYRSKQAAHARASALYHRLKYRTGESEGERR